MPNFKPLNDRILVKVLPEKDVLKGNLYIPDVAKERPQEADVLAVGPGYYIEGHQFRIPVNVEVGDKVYFGKYSGTEIELEGEKFLILKEDEVLGKETKN